MTASRVCYFLFVFININLGKIIPPASWNRMDEDITYPHRTEGYRLFLVLLQLYWILRFYWKKAFCSGKIEDQDDIESSESDASSEESEEDNWDALENFGDGETGMRLPYEGA